MWRAWQVLIRSVSAAGLVLKDMEVEDYVVRLLSQKRRLPNFGNAGTVQSMLSVAKVNKAARLSEADRAWKEAVSRGERPLPPLPHPDVLLKADFAGQVRTKVPAPVL